jgi:hypothetical protein
VRRFAFRRFHGLGLSPGLVATTFQVRSHRSDELLSNRLGREAVSVAVEGVAEHLGYPCAPEQHRQNLRPFLVDVLGRRERQLLLAPA